MAEVWTQWEGQVVNGRYPLRRFLNASDHSSVFLTESATDGFLNAAIKLVPANPASTEMQLWHWKTAATFSHPNLIRLLESGQCEIQGRQLLFVVMEYAEENLSQVLPYRPLEPGEIRELLAPTLDALAFLHRENWVQGQLKPSNLLVVDDHLKLAADTIRPIGMARGLTYTPSAYDPPELDAGEISSAGDVWGLGVMLVEALTQYPPTWPGGRASPPQVRSHLPAEFHDTIQRCLSYKPADRPTIAELQAWTRPGGRPAADTIATAPVATPARAPAGPTAAPPLPSTALPAQVRAAAPATSPVPTQASTRAPATPVAALAPSSPASRPLPPHTPEAPMRSMPQSTTFDEEPKRNITGLSVAVIVAAILALWGGSKLFRGHSSGQPTSASAPIASTTAPQSTPAGSAATSSTAPPPAGPPPGSTPAAAPHGAPAAASAARSSVTPAKPQTATAGDAASSVVHEEIPKVSESSRNTIRGHIKVSIRVTVDQSGTVVRDRFESPGPSSYFNRLASQAARKWKFSPASGDNSREWVLRFEFGREGTTARAVRARS